MTVDGLWQVSVVLVSPNSICLPLEQMLTVTAACIIGASIICVDIIVRKFPGKRNFKIQDSDTFLSSSLSLSFGVMVKISKMPLPRIETNISSFSLHSLA